MTFPDVPAVPEPTALDELAAKIAAFSQYLDDSYRRPWWALWRPRVSVEAVMWRRSAKVGEEFGEAMQALGGMLGENPRKGVTHTREQVVGEQLDVALCALGSVEHLTGNKGRSVALLVEKMDYVNKRAGLS
ncbi:MAG: hypothetical protein JWO15_3729 [Sphingomonadales bacterium]|nr:hypothetical protein [Sphingomonadales bacterium]